jgi:hypothetical protein
MGFSDTIMEVAGGNTLPKVGTTLLVIWNANAYPDPADAPDHEILESTYVGTNSAGNDVFMVVRGADNTSPAIHPIDSVVALNITAGIIKRDLDFVGNTEVDSTGQSDMTGLVYDILFGKLRYKPIMIGYYDNDINMFVISGASNLAMNVYDEVTVQEVVNPEELLLEINDDDITVVEDLQIELDVLNFDLFEFTLIMEDLVFSIDELFLEVSDDIAINELVDFAGSLVDVLDDVSVVEDIAVYFDLDLIISEDILASEDIAGMPDELFLLVIEPTIFVSGFGESFETSFSEVDVAVGDDIAASEDAQLGLI